MRKKILEIFKQIKYKKVFLCFLFFISLSLIYPAGAFAKETRIDSAAEYITDIVKKHTTDNEFVSLIVEPKTDASMKSSHGEFNSLYGAFGELKTNYVGTVNSDKKDYIFFKDFTYNYNLSFIYAEVNSNKEYQGAWKHEYYPLQLMFKGDFSHLIENSFYVYISQSQADILLESKGLDKNEENYLSLIGTNTTIEFNGSNYTWNIVDIYLEINNFYNAITNIMGKFVMGYTHYPENIKKESTYLFTDHDYINKYYLKYVTDLYSFDDYEYSIGTYNLTEGFEADIEVIKNSFKSNRLQFIFFILFFISIIISFFACYCVFVFQHKIKFINYILFEAFSLMPYILYKIIYISSGEIKLFSSISLNIYLFMIILLTIYFATLIVFRNKFKEIRSL